MKLVAMCPGLPIINWEESVFRRSGYSVTTRTFTTVITKPRCSISYMLSDFQPSSYLA
jgi:hypothetical protein